ncbi:MAG TPA: hypothetical protein VGE43_17440 [Acidimicrobiales bacterium]
MLNDPGQDDHDSDLELDLTALDGPDPHAGGDGADHPDDCPPLDDAKEQVGYELFEWDPNELDELDDVLHELGLPHEWVADGYEVVVHVEDEAQVDGLLPTIRFPDELPAEADDGDDTDVEVLSDLFVAADRLHGGATGDAVNGFLDAAERIGDGPPYGIDDKEWAVVVGQVDELIDLFHAAGPAEEITEAAYRLRRRLRPLV